MGFQPRTNYSADDSQEKKTSSFNHADHSFTILLVNDKKKKQVALIMLIIALMN
jgi:hypothetical protein